MKNKNDTLEQILIERMMRQDVSFRTALEYELLENKVPRNIYDWVDYLEKVTDQNMDRVQYYMGILSGEKSDLYLKPNNKEASKG